MQTGDGTRLYHQAAITMICLVVLLIGVLAEEVNLLNRSSVCSERLIVFLTFMLQRDNMVNKGRDIRRLLKRRMMTWKSEHFDDLLFDFKSCSKHLKKCSRMKSDESHAHCKSFHSSDDERSSKSCSPLDHRENKQRWCAGCINLCWEWLLQFGTLAFSGLDVPDSYLIPIGVRPPLCYMTKRRPNFYSAKKVLVKVILCQC